MIFKTKKLLTWPETAAILDEKVQRFIQDLAQLLTFNQRSLYDDLHALEFAENVDAAPTASADIRGKLILIKGGAGVADVLKVCVKNAADAYVFKTVTIV